MCLNLCSPRWFKGAAQKFTYIYLILSAFSKCLKQLLEAQFKTLPEGRDFLEVKKISGSNSGEL